LPCFSCGAKLRRDLHDCQDSLRKDLGQSRRLQEQGKPSLLYIDRHLIHEGTSPQAFSGLRAEGRKVRRPDLTFAVMDHSVPTTDRTLPIIDMDAKAQFEALAKNCQETGVRLFDMNSKNQGIVHIIGPSSASRSRPDHRLRR
jgi:homoaconitase/3-isopropylmalate dehydratase large subunit